MPCQFSTLLRERVRDISECQVQVSLDSSYVGHGCIPGRASINSNRHTKSYCGEKRQFCRSSIRGKQGDYVVLQLSNIRQFWDTCIIPLSKGGRERQVLVVSHGGFISKYITVIPHVGTTKSCNRHPHQKHYRSEKCQNGRWDILWTT